MEENEWIQMENTPADIMMVEQAYPRIKLSVSETAISIKGEPKEVLDTMLNFLMAFPEQHIGKNWMIDIVKSKATKIQEMSITDAMIFFQLSGKICVLPEPNGDIDMEIMSRSEWFPRFTKMVWEMYPRKE